MVCPLQNGGDASINCRAGAQLSTPIPAPVKNLRPAQETCEQCHWPSKFVGKLERTLNYYLPDKSNTLYSVRLLLKVGGGDPTHGPVGGIHWHMNVGNKIDYIATDPKRQQIPWVRVTDQQGAVTIYQTKEFTNDVCWRQQSAGWIAWIATTVPRTNISHRRVL